MLQTVFLDIHPYPRDVLNTSDALMSMFPKQEWYIVDLLTQELSQGLRQLQSLNVLHNPELSTR